VDLQAATDGRQQLAEMVEQGPLVGPVRVRLLVERADAPAFDDGGGVLLNQAAHPLVRLGANRLRIDGHTTRISEKVAITADEPGAAALPRSDAPIQCLPCRRSRSSGSGFLSDTQCRGPKFAGLRGDRT